VARSRTFADYLNAALAADGAAPGPRLAQSAPAPFWFPNAHQAPAGRRLDARRGAAAIRAKETRPHPPPRPRPTRDLTPAQRDALAAMVRLGASLDSGFTAAELRSAFRTLARRYHPDRHPDAGPDEKTRWAREFSVLCENYERLQSIA
jgi:hypothetical protein